jgi:hypothetical protein
VETVTVTIVLFLWFVVFFTALAYIVHREKTKDMGWKFWANALLPAAVLAFGYLPTTLTGKDLGAGFLLLSLAVFILLARHFRKADSASRKSEL